MINLVIFTPLFIFVAISLFATYSTASKPNKNILLLVTLPYKFLTDSTVTEIVKRYKKANWVIFTISLVIVIPLVGIKYTSITILYLCLWLMATMYVYSYILKKYNNQLLSLKKQNDWFLGQCHTVNIDTEVSRIKNKMQVSKVWFLPAIIVSIVPLIIAFTQRCFDTTTITFSLSSIGAIFIFLYLHTLSSRERTSVYCENTEINIACNNIYKRLWTICWIALAAIQSVGMTLLCLYGFSKSKNSWLFYIIIILIICISFVIILAVYRKIRTIQNTLLTAIKDPIYTDDDEYWKNGYYYNPMDNRTMVEKRFGYGYTFNMAKAKAKIINYGLYALVIIIVLWMSFMFLRFDFTTFELSFNGNAIEMQAPIYGYSFDVKDIEGVTIIDTLPKGSRTNGADTEKYSLGNFNLNGYGKSKMYIYKNYPPFLVIQLKDTFVFFNTNSMEETLQYYEMIMDRINGN